jgi:hypothetical protein
VAGAISAPLKLLLVDARDFPVLGLTRCTCRQAWQLTGRVAARSADRQLAMARPLLWCRRAAIALADGALAIVATGEKEEPGGRAARTRMRESPSPEGKCSEPGPHQASFSLSKV